MLNKNKSSLQLFSLTFLLLFSLIGIRSFGQETEEELKDIASKPVYYSLSKALRNAESVYKLNLANKELKEFPEDILKLKELRYLILDSNQIASIPPQISELTKLKCLSLSHNNIQTIPPTLGNLSDLRFLYLDFNKISFLPTELFKLAKLEELFINSNELIVIPAEIKVFKELRRLVASDNKLTSIPDEIGHLYNLKKLTLSKNQISSLPEHFYELTNLKSLYLSENKLKNIDAKINKLNKLEILELDKNEFTSIPSEVGELYELLGLYIEKNKLDSLPKEIGDLFKLKHLYMGDNPLKGIPTHYNRLTNLEYLNIEGLVFVPFPQVLYDLQNKGTKIDGIKGNELYQAKLLLSQARNKKLTEDFPGAIAKYEQLIKADTNNVPAMSELASIYLVTSEYDKAAAVCKRALSKNASQKVLDEVRATYSNSQNRTNQYDLIIGSYESKIKADSTNANPYFDMGKFYFDQKKFDDAKKAFRRAIKVNPSHADSHFYLAIMFLEGNQTELFLFSALRFFELEPNSNRTKTAFPFLLTKMKMRSGVENKRGSTSYFDSYIIRNESNEIVYKSESPQSDLLIAMLGDVLKTSSFSDGNDSTDTDSIGQKIMEQVLYTNKNNTEIFSLELRRFCEKDQPEIKPEDKTFWDFYLPFYEGIIANGHTETYSNIINNIRGNDPMNAKWLKANADKVSKYDAWNKSFKWLK